MSQGWIGEWSPGLGDPTIGGWLTVLLYAWAAWKSYRILVRHRQHRVAVQANELLVWRVLVVGLVALGINKQLDLQSAMTEFARMLAHDRGWYGQRRQHQEAFIAAVAVMGLTAMAALLVLVWHAPTPTLWACAGAVGLIGFVAIRAASFHHVDQMLGWRLAGLPLNWILEMGSLLLVGGGARARLRVGR